jgi:hypothetical protein
MWDMIRQAITNTNKRKTMSAVKKLKADEKKVILAYAVNKLQLNRLSKELDTMKQNVVDVFERSKQNLVIVQDENGCSYGVQKIRRKRKKFETANFKIKHNDLFNQFCTEIEYNEFKAIGDNNDK